MFYKQIQQNGARTLFTAGVELEANSGRHNHVEFPPAPRLYFERADASAATAELLVKRLEIRDADTVTGIFYPLPVVVLHQVERNGVAANTRPGVRLPQDGKPQLILVEFQCAGQAAAGWNHWGNREKSAWFLLHLVILHWYRRNSLNRLWYEVVNYL